MGRAPKGKDVIIIGGGIGGLTLALELHRLGIPCRVFEAVANATQVGVGITILPHAARVFAELGLLDELVKRSVVTKESVFYNRFGQLVHREPLGTFAGLKWPQLSIHRADLYAVLLEQALDRLGSDRITFGARFVRADQGRDHVTAHFEQVGDRGVGKVGQSQEYGSIVIGCDGIHSTLRRQLYPDEGPPRYRGLNMWRGVTRSRSFLTGASMVRVGWYPSGKLTIYPCRTYGDGTQLLNWIAAIETPRYLDRDWGRQGHLEDFISTFRDWKFEFLDVPSVLAGADSVLEFPMVDQDPLPRWSFNRLTLLGDAAHPLVPRGSNGAGQAIIDCRALARALAETNDYVTALKSYEAERLQATSKVIYTNRESAPDAVLREVCVRTNDQPFEKLDEVISRAEMQGILDDYAEATGYSRRELS